MLNKETWQTKSLIVSKKPTTNLWQVLELSYISIKQYYIV